MTLAHLVSIDEHTREDLVEILDSARSFDELLQRPLRKVPALRGKTIVNMFFENSTRTRLSFELAAKRLSADTVNFSASSSSTSKGETFIDTARNIEAMKADLIIVRHEYAGAADLLRRVCSSAVVNAGDGMHQHPTQALLDAYTLLDHFGRPAIDGLTGLTVAIIGDIAHSRVARSNIGCLTKLGATVRVAGPRTMLPADVESLGALPFPDVDSALDGVDAVMMLRIQKERLPAGRMASDSDYRNRFGLSVERAARLKEGACILHPGPINRGVELAPEVADSAQALVLDQVEHGVAVRMAVLYLLLSHRAEGEP